MLNWFKSLSTPWKAFVGLFVVAFFAVSYLTAKVSYSHYQRVKWIKENIEVLISEKQENTIKTDSALAKGEEVTKQTIIKNKAIDKKLENEKSIIDNSEYSNDKLDSLLTKYGN